MSDRIETEGNLKSETSGEDVPDDTQGSGQGEKTMPRRASGITYMALSAFSFSLMAAMVKIGAATLPEQELIVFRSLFIIAVTIPIVRRMGIPLLGNRKSLLVLRGVLGYIAMSCYFWTLHMLPVADAMVIQYASPVFTILWAALFLKEETSPALWIAMAVCMIGVAAVAKPELGGDPLVAVLGLGGAALAGGAYATVRHLRTTDSAYTIVLYFPLVSLPLSLAASWSEWKWPSGWAEWGAVAGVCIASYSGQIFMTKALELERTGRVMAVNYISVAFGVLFGLVLFDTIPDLRSVIGIALILGAITLLTKRS